MIVKLVCQYDTCLVHCGSDFAILSLHPIPSVLALPQYFGALTYCIVLHFLLCSCCPFMPITPSFCMYLSWYNICSISWASQVVSFVPLLYFIHFSYRSSKWYLSVLNFFMYFYSCYNRGQSLLFIHPTSLSLAPMIW